MLMDVFAFLSNFSKMDFDINATLNCRLKRANLNPTAVKKGGLAIVVVLISVMDL